MLLTTELPIKVAKCLLLLEADTLQSWMAHLSCCMQALKEHSSLQEDRTEKQLVLLLTLLLTAHEPVTVLGLSTYPEVMGLLRPEAQKVIQDGPQISW